MADLTDVCNALTDLIQSAVYPNGTSNASVAGVDCKIFVGWPIPKDLDADMKAKKIQVSVYPMPGMDQNTTRFLNEDPQELATPTAELTLTVSSNTVTVGGTVKAGEAAMIAVNRAPYTYGVQATDTLDTIAAALAAKITGATVSGAVITISNPYQLDAGVSAVSSLQTEIARQKRVFMLTTWASLPTQRDVIASTIDVYLKAIPGGRITLADDTYGKIIYRGTLETDELETRRIYRRDLRYEVEYGTTQQSTSNTITNTTATITVNDNTTTINQP